MMTKKNIELELWAAPVLEFNSNCKAGGSSAKESMEKLSQVVDDMGTRSFLKLERN